MGINEPAESQKRGKCYPQKAGMGFSSRQLGEPWVEAGKCFPLLWEKESRREIWIQGDCKICDAKIRVLSKNH